MNEANLYYHTLFNNSKKVELVLKKGLKSKGMPWTLNTLVQKMG